MAKRTTNFIEAVLDDNAAEALKTEIGFKLRVGKQFWRPLHIRMDYWATMYKLLDPIQQLKPLGMRRFISNEPRTAVDAAVSILTRNDSFWRIDQMSDPTTPKEDRRTIGKIERTLEGLVNDADELFTQRGRPPMWKQVAQQLLLRGWCWGKFHVSQQALLYRNAPLIPTIYDSRTVFPHFDDWGLDFVCIETMSTLGNMAINYPDVFADYLDESKWDPNSPAVKIEYWSNDRIGRPGVTGVLGVVQAVHDRQATITQLGAFYDNPLTENLGTARWVIWPYYHGYRPDELPVVGVPANGLKLDALPSVHPLLASRLEERADLLALQTNTWVGPQAWQADSGRGILSAVEDQVPQYNELVATILHYFSLNAFPTWVFTTPTGEIPEHEPGIQARIALRPEEKVESMQVSPITADAYRLLDIVKQERETGVLSSILQAATSNIASGVLFQQIANAALNSLEPYHDAMERFGMAVGGTVLEQMKASASILKPFSVKAPSRSKSFFAVEFDPKVDLDTKRKYKAVPVFKPALPDDLAIRINSARLALDPKNPILSLRYVLENIIQVDDTQGEIDARWEDMVQMDPVIALEMLADAAENMGEHEVAARLRTQEFRTAMAEDMQWQQLTGGGMGEESSNVMPPEAGGGEFNAQQTGGGDEGALAQMGAEILGSMGERGGA